MTQRDLALQDFRRAELILAEAHAYGDPRTGTPPESLYFEDDAREALDKAEFVFKICREMLMGRDEP